MKKLIVIYDNWCPNCTKFINIVKKLDWFNLINYKQLRNKTDIQNFNNLNIELATKQMASFTTKWRYGFISIFSILIRLPLFWLFSPILYFFNITRLGDYLYNELALKRKIIPIHCNSDSCSI